MQWLNREVLTGGFGGSKDQHVTWQRLRAIEAGFHDARVRASLSPEMERVLRRVQERFDDETRLGGFGSRIRSRLAERLIPLAGLIQVAQYAAAANPEWAPYHEPSVPSTVVGDELAKDLLRDPDTGWRYVGLLRAATEPSLGLLPWLFDAVRFEATFAAHLRLFLRAMVAVINHSPTLELTSEQRSQVDLISRQFPDVPGAGNLRGWLRGPAESWPDPGLGRAALPLQTRFELDCYISYAHIDDQSLVESQKGWVSNFHRALEIRVAQLSGASPRIWRDTKLSASDAFEEALSDRIRSAAVFVCIVSAAYVRSDWTRRELRTFWDYNHQPSPGNRLFKILKTPVPLQAQPEELRGFLGYEFFNIDPSTGKVRELGEIFGPEAQRGFWIKLDDVAHDITDTLRSLK